MSRSSFEKMTANTVIDHFLVLVHHPSPSLGGWVIKLSLATHGFWGGWVGGGGQGVGVGGHLDLATQTGGCKTKYQVGTVSGAVHLVTGSLYASCATFQVQVLQKPVMPKHVHALVHPRPQEASDTT
jgi:hypothetical protein